MLLSIKCYNNKKWFISKYKNNKKFYEIKMAFLCNLRLLSCETIGQYHVVSTITFWFKIYRFVVCTCVLQNNYFNFSLSHFKKNICHLKNNLKNCHFDCLKILHILTATWKLQLKRRYENVCHSQYLKCYGFQQHSHGHHQQQHHRELWY